MRSYKIRSHLCALTPSFPSFHLPFSHFPATWATAYSSSILVSLLLWDLCTVPRTNLGLLFPLQTLSPSHLSMELGGTTLSNITISLLPRYSGNSSPPFILRIWLLVNCQSSPLSYTVSDGSSVVLYPVPQTASDTQEMLKFFIPPRINECHSNTYFFFLISNYQGKAFLGQFSFIIKSNFSLTSC